MSSEAGESGTRPSALAALKARRLLGTQATAAAVTSTPTPCPQPSPPDDAEAFGQGTGMASHAAQGHKTYKSWAWVCGMCSQECIPVRTESRCLCGHRLKDHDKLTDAQGNTTTCRCKAAKCTCKGFFYIVAEGSWVLHCRCKHKHTDHDPVTRVCKKAGCKSCTGFDSPWVCNCDHPWSEHKQVVVERQVRSLEEMMAAAALIPDVNRHDLIARGRDAD